MARDHAGIRIGELARRAGRSPEALRAWERRYGLLRPTRSAAGYRLYSRDDEERLRRMNANLAEGYSAAEAARLALAAVPERVEATGAGAALREAIEAFDAAAANDALDRLVEAYSVDAVVGRVVLPYLRELGERWACAEASVGEEHFASDVLEARLHALSRGWDRGLGPRALLACPAGERHEHGLRCFGIALRERGWRVTYLGADTPAEAIVAAAEAAPPAVVVLSAVRPEPLLAAGERLAQLRPELRLALGGAGAGERVAAEVGAELLADDPLAAAAELRPLALAGR